MKTIVICDSSDYVSYQRFENSILSALDFYQIWYQTIDISYTLLEPNDLSNTNLLIIAQEATGKKLTPDDWKIIFKQVSSGMGLLIFDGMVASYGSLISQFTNIDGFDIKKADTVLFEESWISGLSAEKTINTNIPVLVNIPLSPDKNWTVFLRDAHLNPVGIWKFFGKGRITIIGISQGIWNKNCLGHTKGFDGIFWRSIVWTAKKPFIFKGIPPFIACRVNDATGNGKSQQDPAEMFRYVSVLNEIGFIPHVGLCIYDIKENTIYKIRDYFYQSKAEFSAHSFNRDSSERDPSIYLGSDGREFQIDEIRNHFEEVNHTFGRYNIKHAQTINAHRSQIGLNSLYFLRENHCFFSMNLLKPGKIFSDARGLTWEPKPYGIQNFCVDYLDDNQNIFNVVSHPGEITTRGADIDFLPISSGYSVDSIAKKGVFQIKRGLENLTSGCLMFHENRLANFSIGDFETIISIIANELRDIPHIFKSYDFIANYMKNRQESKIANIQYKNSHIFLVLTGKSKMGQFLFCFLENGGNITQSFLEIPQFEKSLELTYKIQQG
ncbi:MAG TPA: hypothetical protein P5065_00470 [Candidatus Ratteibacteria bacterium]|nr:hypothetical protein [bacterium]HOQ81492.1 hypothetical protein [bacterium]HPC28793.1 hypothetical protein [bacterium]HRS05502.1 hypothetical protein [Candidatus Ratteibacteria bacterium]HRV03581.1 hypothetical protein [Candidatus Ratteibacteria bacterium]